MTKGSHPAASVEFFHWESAFNSFTCFVSTILQLCCVCDILINTHTCCTCKSSTSYRIKIELGPALKKVITLPSIVIFVSPIFFKERCNGLEMQISFSVKTVHGHQVRQVQHCQSWQNFDRHNWNLCEKAFQKGHRHIS